jgi:hypothetical protein
MGKITKSTSNTPKVNPADEKAWEKLQKVVANNRGRLAKTKDDSGVSVLDKLNASINAGLPNEGATKFVQDLWIELKAGLYAAAVNSANATLKYWDWVLPCYEDENPPVSRGPIVDLEAHLASKPTVLTEEAMRKWADKATGIVRQVNEFKPVDPIDGEPLTRKDKREGPRGNAEGPYHRKSASRVQVEREAIEAEKAEREQAELASRVDSLVKQYQRRERKHQPKGKGKTTKFLWK